MILLNPMTWLLLIVALIIISALIYTRWKGSKLIYFGYVLAALIIIPTVFTYTNNNIQSSSKVDARQVAMLSEGQVERVEDIWMQFESDDSTRGFSVDELPNNREVSRSYSFWWEGENSTPHEEALRVRVRVFRFERTAINSIRQQKDLQSQSRPKYLFIENENNTEALLYHAVADMPYPIPTVDRVLRSDIRIGNVIITLSETKEWYNLDNNISSQFLELLVDMLW